jgi:hypothetical protein
MRALTANEITILKSRLQVGPDGHSQRVLATGRIPASGAGSEFSLPQMPWAIEMPNGQAGVIFSGLPTDPTVFTRRIYFLRYLTEHTGAIAELFPYGSFGQEHASYHFGLVVWNGALLAVMRRPSDGALRYRTSADSGATWAAEAALGITLDDAHVTMSRPAFQLTTNKAGTKLFLFYSDAAASPPGWDVLWRETVNANPTLGWSAEANTNAHVPSCGRNFGGPSAYNSAGVHRAFIMCETETANTWAMACESDDGDWHANHMCATGTLGGAGFTNVLNVGYGGGLSGGQGANGGVFLDSGGELLFYVMDDGGGFAEIWRSTDSGATWSSPTQLMPAGLLYGEGIGAGCGRVINGYVGGPDYIWGGCGSFGGNPPAPRMAMGVCDVTFALTGQPNWLRILGTGVDPGFGAFNSVTVDISDRVRAISEQKDTDMDAAGFNIELANTDGACNPNNPAAALYPYIKPNAHIQIEQWYGDVANTQVTFTGIVSQLQGSADGQTVTIVGLDRCKKLLKQNVDVTAPQTFGTEGAIRDMGNYVYINKTINEVLDDLMRKAFIVPETEAVWWPSTYVFKELSFQSGSLMAAAKRAALAAGLRFWADEDGLFRTAPLIGGGLPSSWTYRASEDVLVPLTTELDDDTTYTRVRIIGKANIGARYLQELLFWNGFGAPRGIDYDPLTGQVWYLDADGTIRRLDPTNNMNTVAGPYATGLTNLDGITVDPNDNHLWVSHNATYRKLDRADPTSTLVGPFAAPDGNRCGIWAWDNAGTTRLKMVTRTTEDIVTMSVAGAEVSRVACPVAKPTAISGDSGGGLFITGLDLVDFYQVDFAGNIVNTIKQAFKNGSDLGIVDRPTTAYDFGDVYQVFGDGNSIVKYAVAGTPENVERSTIAEAIDLNLEIEIGEVRLLPVVDLGLSDRAMAQATANRLLPEASRLRRRIPYGAVGNPGLQINDRITLVSPHDDLNEDFVVRSIRSDQTADPPTYLMVVIVEPYIETGT